MLNRGSGATYSEPMLRDKDIQNTIKQIFSEHSRHEEIIMERLEDLAADHGESVFQAAIGLLLGKDLDEKQAANFWRGALIRWRHQRELRPGLLQIKTALLDYLETVAGEKLNSSLDGITGLFNENFFHHHLVHQLATLNYLHHHQSLALIKIRMDRFERLSWSFSQQELDQLQRHVAREIKVRLRDIDTAVRFCDGEFGIILPYSSLNTACKLVEKLQAVLVNGRWNRIPEAVPFPTTISAGIATYPNDGCSARRLLHVAKQQLKEAAITGDSIFPMAVERRKQLRKPFHTFLEISNGNGSSYLPAISCNISEIGMALECEEGFDPGLSVKIRCRKPFWPVNRDIEAAVTRIDERSWDGICRLAVQFNQKESRLSEVSPVRLQVAPENGALLNPSTEKCFPG